MYQCRRDPLLVRSSQEGSRCYYDVTWLWELCSMIVKNPLVMQRWVAAALHHTLIKPLWNKSFSCNPPEGKKKKRNFLKSCLLSGLHVLCQSSLLCCFLLFSVQAWGRGSCLHVGDKANPEALLAWLFLTHSSPRGCVRPVLASWSLQMKVFPALPWSSVKAKEYVEGSCQS